jgi:hypothetical protein
LKRASCSGAALRYCLFGAKTGLNFKVSHDGLDNRLTGDSRDDDQWLSECKHAGTIHSIARQFGYPLRGNDREHATVFLFGDKNPEIDVA